LIIVGQVRVRETENKMPKMQKNLKNIVKDEILLKFGISNISIF